MELFPGGRRLGLAVATSILFLLLLLLLLVANGTKPGVSHLLERLPTSLEPFSRIVVEEPPLPTAAVAAPVAVPVAVAEQRRRSLRGGGRGGPYPVTSPTNGGQLVSPGVPWAPFSIAEAQAKYPPNAVRSVQNGLLGQRRQDNALEDDVYDHLRVYARLQRRAEDPALVAALQEELGSPAYLRLRQSVQDPDFQYSLQAGLYRRARKYQEMEDRVSDPAFGTSLQATMYRSMLRPGPPRQPQLNAQATAVETRPLRPSHVP